LSENKELIFGLQMLPLPGAYNRFIAVYCMIGYGTSRKQNGGDMNESEFRYQQLNMWLSLRGLKKESPDRPPPPSHLPGGLMLCPATYHALFPVILYTKFLFRRLRF